MGLLNRINSRRREEGYLKTLQYGVFVGVDMIKTYALDSYLDLRYSGRMLHGNKVSNFKHIGANDVYHTDYSVMPLIFSNLCIDPEDVLVDVGCGQGRVINYWLSKNYQNQIIGLEIDPDIAKNAESQFANRFNVKIIQGDAVENLPPEGTVFYFYNPFDEQKVVEFEQKVREITRENQIKVIYYNPKSISVFDKQRWNVRKIDFDKNFGVKRWGRLNKYHELAIITKSGSGCSEIP